MRSVAVICLLASASVAEANAFDHVAGTVDGTPIWQSQLDESRAVDPTSTREAVADHVLLVRAAKHSAFDATYAEVDQALESIEKQNSMTPADLEKVIVDRGATWEGYRDFILDELLVLRQEKLEPKAETLAKARAAARIVWRPDVARDASGDPKGDIREIVVTGKDIDDALRARVKEAVGAVAGTPLDRTSRVLVRRALAKILEEQIIAGVAITADTTSRGVRLTVALDAQPFIGDVDREELAPMLGLRLDPAAAKAARDEALDHVMAAGHPWATARWTTEPRNDGSVKLALVVDEGARVHLTEIAFDGAKTATPAELRGAIAKYLVPDDDWNQERVEMAALLISAFYWDRGYANVKVDPPTAPKTSGDTVAHFTIVEGKRYKLGRIRTSGISADVGAKDLATTTLRSGDVFSRSAIAASRDAIKALVEHQVSPNADVMVTTHIDEALGTIDLMFEITR